MKLKALKIIAIDIPDEERHEYPESGFVGFSHAYGFGSSGEFTACDVDLATSYIQKEQVELVDCPDCARAMDRMLSQCKKFKVKRI